MKPLRIAHISDLHVGHENRGLDMCPHELKPSEKIGRADDYVATFESLVRTAEFKAAGPIAMLCVTGDISNRAHAEEFVYADKAIRRIATALELPEQQVFYVPGNHDVHWPVMQMDPKNFWADYRYAPLLQEGLTFKSRATSTSQGAFDKPPYFVAWEHANVLVIAVNSAAYDGPDSEFHPGAIQQETVDALQTYLKTKTREETQLRLCLLHHHPFPMSEPIPNVPDPTLVTNAENFLNVLAEHYFDLVLHGHKHQPRLKTHLINNAHPFVSMCAGSFSAVLHPLHFDGSSNLFHVVNVHGRDKDSGGIKGNVQSWTHKAGGKWEPSHLLRGIPAVEAFGSQATRTQVRADVKSALESHMKSNPFCRWDDILQIHAHLEHVRADVLHPLMLEVSQELGLDMAGDIGGAPSEWAVFRRK
jgi:3',5'-cyclic AMP phosphodiesterase CpdA